MDEPRAPLIVFLRQNAGLFLLGLAHLPLLVVYFAGLWRIEHYQFFPFALGAAGLLYVQRGERSVLRPNLVSLAVLGLDLLMLAVAALANWPKLAMLGFILFCWVLGRSTSESRYQRSLSSLALLPALLLSPPRGLDLQAIFWLQQQTTWLASRLLEQLGYLHLCRGNIIELPGRQLMVEEACSGVQSLFTVLFLALLIVCWRRRSLVHGLLLIPSAVVFAGLMNVFRISAIVVAWQEWQLDLSGGWQHDALGYVALALAIGMLLSMDSLLHFLFSPFRDHIYGPFSATFRNPFTTVWNYLFGALRPRSSDGDAAPGRFGGRILLAAGGLGVAIALLQVAVISTSGSRQLVATDSGTDFFPDAVLSTGPLEGFEVSGYETQERAMESTWGRYSNLWQLTGHRMKVVVSCDHPFLDWHHLNLCYTGNGWDVLEVDELDDDPEWRSLSLRMKDEVNSRYGCVIYSHFQIDGQPFQPTNPSLSLGYAMDRVGHYLKNGLGSLMSGPADRTTFQIQVFAESSSPLTEQQQVVLQKLHRHTRMLLLEHFRATQLSGAQAVVDSSQNESAS